MVLSPASMPSKKLDAYFASGKINVLEDFEMLSVCNVLSKIAVLQLCLAYKNDGGKVIVVMTTREKLEMEATFRRVIPESKRHKTQFVFRQGSCLVPDDLRMVAASDAGSTIIVSDSSRCFRILPSATDHCSSTPDHALPSLTAIVSQAVP